MRMFVFVCARRVYLSRYACVYLCAVNLVPNTGFITLFRPFENANQNKYRIRVLPIGVYTVLSFLYIQQQMVFNGKNSCIES